ncbi:hypothetical protein NVV30_10590 [Pseudomonas syringae]|uniref:hypothetical protein n=1 Tax=Pseudomonas syringae TaxID=317 RepID=UPI00215A4F11|nr:hypothetical protein [Pseudomonas syringae]MCR8719134.1 hypothetical protein [Pseudomonas syringae]
MKMNNTFIYGGADPEVTMNPGSAQSSTYTATNNSKKEMIMLIESEIETTLQRLESFKIELNRITNAEMEENALYQSRQLDQLNDVLSENQLLLEKLHEAQEAYELLMQRDELKTNSLNLQSNRLANLLQKFPAHWEVEHIDIKRLNDDDTGEVTQWQIRNAYLGDELVPLIKLKTRLSSDQLELFIQRTDDKNSNWINWPQALSEKELFPCTPVHGHAYQGNNWLLSSLGTSDWGKLRLLIRRMASSLGNGSDITVPKDINASSLKEGLLNLTKQLDNWPLSLRYDNVALTKTVQTEHYRSLSISLTNVSLGEKRWDKLEYNLATVDENGGFGQNPRLEFPESARDVIDNWFVESEDGRGLRLELRFAHPQAIDTNVWRLLSDADQILIAALVSNLSIQLDRLERGKVRKSLHWQEWQGLAQAVREIMVNYMRPHRNNGT